MSNEMRVTWNHYPGFRVGNELREIEGEQF
jgi:hypothetical protein